MTSEPDGSVTRWIKTLADPEGDADEAARRLWDRYSGRIIRLARTRLRGASRGPADEEDAALSAFDSLFRGVAAGRFARLEGRDELWRLLVTITMRKAANLVRREGAQRRGGGRVVGEAELDGRGEPGFGRIADEGPTPEFVALMGDEVRRLFGLLGEESLRVIALLKLEGYTNEEAATSLDLAVRSVERKVERIRNLWSGEGQSV